MMVATGLSVFILAGVLTANLQIVRGGVRVAQYAEMESQVRRALDQLGYDLRTALDITWNGVSDITLTIPAPGGTTSRVTYAWTSASGTFFRVAGSSSATLTGRLELVRGIAALPGGGPGLTFARYDCNGVAATTNGATKIISVSMTVSRRATTAASTSQDVVSATFALRCKPST
ncbi:MAG: hypothetical protein FJ399_16795 [Verrucomicrobia bacterium]|nr:hypothetical protein [Verrucomicrobiota bacterium]